MLRFSVRREEQSLLDMKKVEVGKDAAIEAEVKAARERAVVPVEIRMKQFRDMLAEKEVSDNNLFVFTLQF